MDWTFLVLMAMYLMHFLEEVYLRRMIGHLLGMDATDPNDPHLRLHWGVVQQMHAILWGVAIYLPILIVSKWSVRAEVWTVLFIAVFIHMYIDWKMHNGKMDVHTDSVAHALMVMMVWLTWTFYL